MIRSTEGGFASIFAILMIALVGGAILAVTSLLAADARRTANEWRDAQLRQLVTAAAMDLTTRTRAGENLAGQSYALPPPVGLPGAQVHCEVDRAGHAVIRVQLDTTSLEQSFQP
jgi:hypothetical protein